MNIFNARQPLHFFTDPSQIQMLRHGLHQNIDWIANQGPCAKQDETSDQKTHKRIKRRPARKINQNSRDQSPDGSQSVRDYVIIGAPYIHILMAVKQPCRDQIHNQTGPAHRDDTCAADSYRQKKTLQRFVIDETDHQKQNKSGEHSCKHLRSVISVTLLSRRRPAGHFCCVEAHQQRQHVRQHMSRIR